MALYYPPLNWSTTEKIWRNLIRRTLESSTLKVECSLDDLITFARQLFEEQERNSDPTHWNGRQIRNAFQSAIALARNEASGSDKIVVVEPRHFSTVARVSNEFNTYLWKVKSGRNDADIAKEVQSRHDDFDRTTYAQGPSMSQPHQYAPPVQVQMPMRQTVPSVPIPKLPNAASCASTACLLDRDRLPLQPQPARLLYQCPAATSVQSFPRI
jgi:hypothetical protein